MNTDCLKLILLNCDHKLMNPLLTVCKDFYNTINDDEFWQRMMLRDYEDIHKVKDEKWIDYYRRRKINHGQPVIINKKIFQYNQIIQFLSYSKDIAIDEDEGNNKSDVINKFSGRINLILTKDGEIYIVDKDFIHIKHRKKITKIYCNRFGELCFLDCKNDMFELDIVRLKTKFLRSDVLSIIEPHNSTAWFYNKIDGSYVIDFIEKETLFKFSKKNLIAQICYDDIDYYINHTNNLCVRNEIDGTQIEWKTKVTQISQLTSSKCILILNINGFAEFFRGDIGITKRIEIPNVCLLGYNCFLTTNGDLYTIINNYEVKLVDTDVIHAHYVIDDGKKGCYIKRAFC